MKGDIPITFAADGGRQFYFDCRVNFAFYSAQVICKNQPGGRRGKRCGGSAKRERDT